VNVRVRILIRKWLFFRIHHNLDFTVSKILLDELRLYAQNSEWVCTRQNVDLLRSYTRRLHTLNIPCYEPQIITDTCELALLMNNLLQPRFREAFSYYFTRPQVSQQVAQGAPRLPVHQLAIQVVNTGPVEQERVALNVVRMDQLGPTIPEEVCVHLPPPATAQPRRIPSVVVSMRPDGPAIHWDH
jgi:hypothetical protein